MKLLAALVLATVTAFGCETKVADTQKSVEERLTCQCGCGLTIHTCNHLQCSFGVPVKKDIAVSLEAGQSAEEILDRYVAEYGEKILSSPTTEGFNLLAWYGPYVAIVGSALMILVVIRRSRGPAGVAGTPAAAKPPISDDARRRLDDELDDMRP